MHIFFSVGEPSGDLHGAKLVRELQQRHPGVKCSGFGGPLMQTAGCQIIFQLTDLAVMGFLRVVPMLWKFYRLVRMARHYFETERPDAVVLVDFPGFNWWIARQAHRLGIPVFYYLPPQLWAWAPWRVRRMRRFVDHVLCCLPFEEGWYRKRGVSVEFVGHPFFDEVAERQLDHPFLQAVQGDGASHTRTVAILPGSRGHEVTQNFPIQLEVARRLHARVPGVRFLIACYKEKQRTFCEQELARNGCDLPIVLYTGRTSEIIEAADICLMVSGSVSLELLARTTPAVVVYKISRTLYWLGRVLVTCHYISLPNLIADRAVLPEFAPMGDPSKSIEQMTEILNDWLTDSHEHSQKVRELELIRDEVASTGATGRAAASILARLQAAASESEEGERRTAA